MVEAPVVGPRCSVRTSYKPAPSFPPVCLTKNSLSTFLYCPAFFYNKFVLHKIRKYWISQTNRLILDRKPTDGNESLSSILAFTHNSFPTHITKSVCKIAGFTVYSHCFNAVYRLSYSLKQLEKILNCMPHSRLPALINSLKITGEPRTKALNPCTLVALQVPLFKAK